MSSVLAAGHVLIGANISPALRGMAQVDAAFRSTGSKMGRTGSVISKAIGLPIAAAFAYSIKAAADFESALNNMQAVSGATAGQMKKVGATAKALGADVKLPGTSAKDAADAMVELAKGGLSAEQSMRAARGTLMLSAAAGIDNAQAATIQVRALNAFGLSAQKAGKVSDLLAASANASTSEITDMAQALQASSAVAHQANYSIDDTVTALSMLANAGIAGSDAGTSLKTMLLRLQAPMGVGAKMVAQLGLNLRDSGGELKKLPALADEFRSKTEGMTKAQRDAAFAAIFGSDAIRAANILLGKGSTAFDQMKGKVTQAGAAQQLAAAKMKGFNGSLEAFKSAAQTAAISVGTILLPMATSLVGKLTDLASAFENLTPEQQKMVMGFAAVAAAAGPALVVLSKFQGLASSLPTGLAGVGGPLGIAAVAFGALAMSSDSARESFAQMASALSPLASILGQVASSPITLWMVGVGAAALGMVKAVMAARAAITALSVAVAANPLGAFVVGAGLVLGAIIGISSALGGGQSAMQRFADATRNAKAALDSLKDSTNNVKGAALQHQAAILEVKAAQQQQRAVQEQVSSGQLKGKDASLALAQADLRVKQAKLGVVTSSQAHAKAVDDERGKLVTYNAETQKAISAARDRVAQLKGVIAATGGNAKANEALKAAERDLATAMANAGKQTGATTGQLNNAKKGADNLAGGARNAKAALDTVKSKTITVSANTQQAIMAIAGVVANLALVASKTITVTIVPVHKKGSWTVQQTIEALRAEPKKRSFETTFTPKGTGSIEASLAAVNTLQRQLDRINAQREAKDRAAAVADAQRALADARKKGEGVLAAERALARARQDVVVAGIENRLAIAQKGYDREKAQLDRLVEAAANARERIASSSSNLSGLIGQGIDSIAAGKLSALDSSPEAQRLRQIETNQKAAQTERERARLQDAIDQAQTDDERRTAIEDMNDWETEQTRQKLADQLQAKRDEIQREADARKTATDRGLSDLAAAFNKGLISNAQYVSSVQALIGSQVGDYNALGGALGFGFVSGFAEQLNTLISSINQVARISGSSAGAVQKITLPGPDFKGFKTNVPKRAARGGIVGGSGLTDKVPILAAPGEGILSHRGMDNLMEMAMDGRRGGGGASSITVVIEDRTMFGVDRTQARRLADAIAPELNRRVSMAA